MESLISLPKPVIWNWPEVASITPSWVLDRPVCVEPPGEATTQSHCSPTADQVVDTIVELLVESKAVLVGHNVTFDRDFIAALVRRQGRTARLGYHTVDTVTLCYTSLVPCGLTALSLDSVRRFLDIPTQGSHAALKDALDAREVYYRITRAAPEGLWELNPTQRQ